MHKTSSGVSVQYKRTPAAIACPCYLKAPAVDEIKFCLCWQGEECFDILTGTQPDFWDCDGNGIEGAYQKCTGDAYVHSHTHVFLRGYSLGLHVCCVHVTKPPTTQLGILNDQLFICLSS